MRLFQSRLRMFCSLLVSAVLLGQVLVPAIAFAAPKPKPKPIPKEMVERRGPRSKTFDNGDGTYTYQSFMSRIHYRDAASGLMLPVDSALDPIETSPSGSAATSDSAAVGAPGRGWKNRANSFKLSLPERLGSEWISVETSHARIAYRPAKAAQSRFGIATDAVDVTGTPAPGSADAVKYSGPFGPSTSLDYLSIPEGAKESIVLSRFEGKSTFSFDLTLSGVTPRFERNGSIGLYTSTEATAPSWTIAAPYMEDSAQGEGGLSASSHDVRYELTPNGLYWRLDVVADPVWLASPDRVFPVRIDPTITLNDYGTWQNNSYPATMDTFITDANLTGNFGNYWSYVSGAWHADLRVGYTAGAGNNRALIMPDVSDLMGWNADNRVKIIHANMNLNCYSRTGGGGPVYIGKVTGQWGEDTVTWNTRPAYTDLGTGRGKWVGVGRTQFPVDPEVQQWMDTGDAKGFMFFSTWADPAGWCRFDAREGGSVGPVFECSFTTQPKVTFTLPPADVAAGTSPTANWSTYDMWGKTQSKVNIEVKRIGEADTAAKKDSIVGTGTISALPAPEGGWTTGRYLVRLKAECAAPPTTGYTAISEWTPWTPFDVRPLIAGSDQSGVLPYRAADSIGGGAVDLASGRLLLGRQDFSGPGQAGPLAISATYDSSRTTNADGVGRGFRLDVPTLRVVDERVVNAGFETGTGTDASEWWENSGWVTRQTGTGRSGAGLRIVPQSTELTYTAINATPTAQTPRKYPQALPVYPGEELVATAWVKTSGLTPATGTSQQRGAVVRIHYFDDAGTDLGEAKYASSSGVVTSTGSGWRQITVRAEVPEGAFRAAVAAEVIRASGTAYFDDVQFGDGAMVMTDSGGTTRPFAQIGHGVYQRDPLAPTLSVKRIDALSGVKPTGASGFSSGITGASTDGNCSLAAYDWVATNPVGSSYLQYDLPHPAVLSDLDLYLWDGIEATQRTYTYRIDVLPTEVADPSAPWESAIRVVDWADLRRSWNRHSFTPIKARAVRIYAIGNTANSNFHVPEVRAPITQVNDATVVTDKNGHIAYAADEAGNLTTYDWDYHSHPERLLSVSDKPGRKLTLNWDSGRNSLTSLDYHGIDSSGGGSDLDDAVTYGSDGETMTISRKRDNGTPVVVAAYHSNDSTDSPGAKNRIDRITDADGVRADILWDDEGRVGSVTRSISETASVVTSYDYSTANQVKITTTGGGLSQSRIVFFDPALGNQVTSTVADPDGFNLATSYTYDGYGHVSSTINPLDETDTYQRDAHGNALTTVIRASDPSLLQTETATYTNDRTASSVDAKGNVSSSAYDWAWRAVSSAVALTDSGEGATAASTQAFDDWGNRVRDDIPVSTASNLLEDPAFEHDPFAVGGGWRRDPNMALVPTGAGTQSYMGRSYIEGSGETTVNAVTDPKVMIKANETYQVSAWTRGHGAVIVRQYAGTTLKSTTTVIDVTSGNVGLARQVGTFVARSDATSCEVWLSSYASGGHAAFDNVRLEAANAAGTDDWLENESFERQPVSGAPYHWTQWQDTNCFADKVPTRAGDANAVWLRVAANPGTRTGSASWYSERLRVKPSEAYTAGISMTTSKILGAQGDSSAGAAAQVYFYASDSTPDSSPMKIVYLTGDKLITGSTAMIRYANRIDVPTGATSAKFVMILNHAEGSAYFDNATVEPAISVTAYGYDSTHTFSTDTTLVTGARTSSVTDVLGRTQSSSYIPTVGADPVVTRRASYDSQDRVKSVTIAPDSELAASASFDYTDGGKLKTITDPRGKVTSFAYDPLSGVQRSATSPMGVIRETSYDALGRVSSVMKPHVNGQPAEVLTTNTYDSLGRNVGSVTYGEASQTVTSGSHYDDLSRVKSQTVTMTGEAPCTSHTEYDSLGREKSSDTTGAAGFTRVTDITYDKANLPLTTTWEALGKTGTITNTYAKTNEWLSTTDSTIQGGHLWSFSTGADGTTRQITSPLASLSFGLDSAHRLSTVRAARAAGVNQPKVGAFSETLGYDGWSRISSDNLVSATANLPTVTDAYQYFDAAGALKSWTRSGTCTDSASYTYDVAGNLATITRKGATMSLAVDDDNRLTSTTGTSTTTYTNDLSGRRTSRTTASVTTTYTYDASGHLADIASPTRTAHYSYGITGMREAKSVTGDTTSTITSYWLDQQLTAERDADGTTYKFLYGPGGTPLQLSVTSAGGATTAYAYLIDRAGSVIGLTDISGTVIASYTYDPWGNPTSVDGSNPILANRQPLRYRGYYYDTESALYYLPARYYDPAVGRFLSVDPVAPSADDPITLNAYTYCVNNPVMMDDPEGTWPGLSSGWLDRLLCVWNAATGHHEDPWAGLRRWARSRSGSGSSGGHSREADRNRGQQGRSSVVEWDGGFGAEWGCDDWRTGVACGIAGPVAAIVAGLAFEVGVSTAVLGPPAKKALEWTVHATERLNQSGVPEGWHTRWAGALMEDGAEMSSSSQQIFWSQHAAGSVDYVVIQNGVVITAKQGYPICNFLINAQSFRF